MDKKLLHKTSRTYLLYFVLILLISAPVFYFAIQRIYINEADDTLRLHKKEFEANYSTSLKETEIPAWNNFNRNVKIEPGSLLRRDSLFFSAYYDTLDAELEPYRELNAPIKVQGTPYTYTARINLVETKDLLKNIAFLFSAIITILLIGLYFISRRLSASIWKPFYKTLDQIESFEIDKSSTPVFSNSDIEEFNRLNTSIEKLIARNRIIYTSQREFIENAAHELQTPLAVFQAKIDNLMQRADVSGEQADILASLNENVSRLNRLNKNLLLLSKIDNDTYHQTETVRVAESIQKNLEFFTSQASSKNLKLRTDLNSNLSVQANPALVEVLISNLFLNAIRHNKRGGHVVVTLQNNSLVFENTGSDDPLKQENLFNRFSKTNSSSQGTGLGLSIVKKIASLYNWHISYTFTDNRHVFTLRF